MNNFMLSYNPYAVIPTNGQLLNYMQNSRFVDQFFQPYHGTYLIKSGSAANVLNAMISGLFEGSPYILAQVFSHSSGGSLPSEIWNWLNFGTVPPVSAPPPAYGRGTNALSAALATFAEKK